MGTWCRCWRRVNDCGGEGGGHVAPGPLIVAETDTYKVLSIMFQDIAPWANEHNREPPQGTVFPACAVSD